MERETRSGLPVEIRAKDNGTVTVEGYAALYDSETVIAGLFREVIRPGAFRNALARGDDVTLNINHNDNFLLARTKSGTLHLEEDEKGLKIRSELDPTDPDVARLVPKMKRGDLSEMSFAFSIPDGGQAWSEGADGMDVREIRDVMLHDVSIVPTPAYGGTSIALRSRDAAGKIAEEERDQESRKFHDAKGYFARKLRLIELPARKPS
jgi:HK97 family phage prohead protease